MTFDKEGFNVETLADEEKNNLGVSQHNDPIKKLQSTKSLNIRKTELMASCYDRWYHHVFLLFAAFLCGYGYGLDGNIRSVYTSYAAASYAAHPLISTLSVVTGVMSAASQIFFARLSDVFGRLSLFVTAIAFYVVGTIIQSQASLRYSEVCCWISLLEYRIRGYFTHANFDSIRFLLTEVEAALPICSFLARYN